MGTLRVAGASICHYLAKARRKEMKKKGKDQRVPPTSWIFFASRTTRAEALSLSLSRCRIVCINIVFILFLKEQEEAKFLPFRSRLVIILKTK